VSTQVTILNQDLRAIENEEKKEDNTIGKVLEIQISIYYYYRYLCTVKKEYGRCKSC